MAQCSGQRCWEPTSQICFIPGTWSFWGGAWQDWHCHGAPRLWDLQGSSSLCWVTQNLHPTHRRDGISSVAQPSRSRAPMAALIPALPRPHQPSGILSLSIQPQPWPGCSRGPFCWPTAVLEQIPTADAHYQHPSLHHCDSEDVQAVLAWPGASFRGQSFKSLVEFFMPHFQVFLWEFWTAVTEAREVGPW